MTDETASQEIIERELALHSSDVRADADSLRALLHPDFLEIGASGSVWTVASVAERLPQETAPHIEAIDFQCSRLSDGVMLVTYQAAIDGARSWRSSVWMHTDRGWQMRFHQGTKRV